MTLESLESLLRANMNQAVSDGFHFVAGFGSPETKTCCAISANGLCQRPSFDVYEAAKKLNIEEDILWAIAFGFDGCNTMSQTQPEAHAIGQKLRLEFAAHFQNPND